jgi:cytochrome c-type biogenesis protein CcmH/NrfG
MVWKHIAALAALILISYPAAAFNDGPTQQTQGITFFVAVPLDGRDVKEQSLYSGLAIQGKRAHENVRIDSRMFNDTRTVNFFGTGIEVKWIIAGVVAAGAVAAVATKEKATTTANQQQQQQQQQQQAAQEQQQQNGGGGSVPCPVTC